MEKHQVWLNGSSGKMGRVLQALIRQSNDFELIGLSDADGAYGPNNQELTEEDAAKAFRKTSLIIDFSSVSGNEKLFERIKSTPQKLDILICTTGLSTEQVSAWHNLINKNKQISLLFARNTSTGVLATQHTITKIAKLLLPLGYDCEIVETHHSEKVDTPSGTALMLAEAVCSVSDKHYIAKPKPGKRTPNSVTIHSVRGGGVFGQHKVRFFSQFDEIIVEHQAFSRELFGEGALVLSRWLIQQVPGLYSVDDIDPTALV